MCEKEKFKMKIFSLFSITFLSISSILGEFIKVLFCHYRKINFFFEKSFHSKKWAFNFFVAQNCGSLLSSSKWLKIKSLNWKHSILGINIFIKRPFPEPNLKISINHYRTTPLLIPGLFFKCDLVWFKKDLYFK